MRSSAKIILSLALLLPCFVPAAGLSAVPELRPGEVRVSEDTLRTDVEFLADGLCAGRATGSRGSVEATAYIARRLASMGYAVAAQGFAVDSSRVGHNILASVPAGGRSFAESAPDTPNGHSPAMPAAVLPNSQQEILGEAGLLLPKGKPVIVLIAYYDGLGTLGGRIYPGADSNASGVAALLALAARLKGRNDVLFAFVDAHNAGGGGTRALRRLLEGRRISLVVNLDIVGATLSPVDSYWPDYLMALGAGRWRKTFERCNAGLQLHLYYDYYRSRSFTDMFYRRAGEQAAFVAAGVPAIMFTSGITANTNKPDDTPDTLDYDILSRRVEFIARFIATL